MFVFLIVLTTHCQINDNSRNSRIVSETPLGTDPVEQRPPAVAIPTDRQPSHHLLRQNVNPINYWETRFKRQGTPQTSRFQPALSGHNCFTRPQAQKRQVFFDSLDRNRAQLRQFPTGGPCLSTSVSSPESFSLTLQQQTPPEYLERQKEIQSRYTL